MPNGSYSKVILKRRNESAKSMLPRLLIIVLFAVLILAPVTDGAQTQAVDEDFARTVREWTTRPEFLSSLVDHLPKSSTVPSP